MVTNHTGPEIHPLLQVSWPTNGVKALLEMSLGCAQEKETYLRLMLICKSDGVLKSV
jgi:hypothetical protein